MGISASLTLCFSSYSKRKIFLSKTELQTHMYLESSHKNNDCRGEGPQANEYHVIRRPLLVQTQPGWAVCFPAAKVRIMHSPPLGHPSVLPQGYQILLQPLSSFFFFFSGRVTKLFLRPYSCDAFGLEGCYVNRTPEMGWSRSTRVLRNLEHGAYKVNTTLGHLY